MIAFKKEPSAQPSQPSHTSKINALAAKADGLASLRSGAQPSQPVLASDSEAHFTEKSADWMPTAREWSQDDGRGAIVAEARNALDSLRGRQSLPKLRALRVGWIHV